jgi:O-6-methylguanine DNA methyltransferase
MVDIYTARDARVASAVTGGSGRFATPWGEGLVVVRQGRLAGVELPPVLATEPSEIHKNPEEGDRAVVARWVKALETYFSGGRLSWTAEEIELDRRETGPFRRAVYGALLTVPAGVTVSYGALAEMAGFPRAARAVGTAMASNPIPIVVPCHRVIKSDGSLGRYGNDPSWKERLLAHELKYADRGVTRR